MTNHMTNPMNHPSRNAGSKPITRALPEFAPGADAPNLRRVLDSLIGKAIGGDLAAIKEILDRIDGKVPAAGAGADAQEPRKVVFEWKSDE
jgi:hypothetical protein